MTWTVEQALALTPSSSVRAAARPLAAPVRWARLERSDRAVWGLIKGSAKEPYAVQIDISGPALRCSCPSRLHPCKHAVALALLLPLQPEAFSESDHPGWVSDWLSSRDERQARVDSRREARPADPEALAVARSKRAQERVHKVDAGVAELRLWLSDLVRNGIASAPGQPLSYWSHMASRMIDAQAPGLARRINTLSVLAHSGTGWADRVAEEIGDIFLLLEGWRRLEGMPAALAAEVRTWIGFTVSREEVIATGPRVADHWLVVGRRVYLEERLQTQRTWLLGMASGRAALELEFAAPGERVERSLAVGSHFDAEVAFSPGTLGHRGFVTGPIDLRSDATPVPSTGTTITGALNDVANAIAVSPWARSVPVLLEGVTPILGTPNVLRDETGDEVAIRSEFAGIWQLVSVSGARPARVFAECDGMSVMPFAAWDGARVVGLPE